jgi:hypothetical protein
MVGQSLRRNGIIKDYLEVDDNHNDGDRFSTMSMKRFMGHIRMSTYYIFT